VETRPRLQVRLWRRAIRSGATVVAEGYLPAPFDHVSLILSCISGMDALWTLEAAARHLNFARAIQELDVTLAAISPRRTTPCMSRWPRLWATWRR
jgi:hypothetical protein